MIPAEKWQELSTAVVSDCMNRMNVMDPRIQSMTGAIIAGPAFPVETLEGENGTVHRAIAAAPPGSVLVIEAGGNPNRAIWGDVLTEVAVQRGVIGVVLNGAVRDLSELRQRKFPIFAIGSCPAGPHKGWQGRIGVSVSCGGVVVEPGDTVFGDTDGVVVIPRNDTAAVYEQAVRRNEMERIWMQRIRSGESNLAVLGIEEAENS
jgi:4-hydroxy-4-methyl-2-oxoglutarate aldolase